MIAELHLARLRRRVEFVRVADAFHLPQWQRLARRAALSAYRDCVALGRADAARAILTARTGGAAHPARRAHPSPAIGAPDVIR